MSRRIKLALAPHGVGGPGQHGRWKDPRIAKNASVDIDFYIDLAKRAEAALFDALFIVDSQFINESSAPHFLNRLEPLTLLSAVATHTTHLGLVATASSTYNSPYNLARRIGSLDLISHGRAAWNVVTSWDQGAARNFNADEHLDYATRYGRAKEFVEVARGLWDTYEDGAFPADVEADRFLDPSRLHVLNHRGEHFRVDGPLALQRSEQGQPVIFQAGVSDEGRDLAAQVADATFAPGAMLEQAQEYYRDLKARAVALGRDPEEIKVLIFAEPVVAATDEAAEKRAREIQAEDRDFDASLAQLGRGFGAYDFTQHDLDAPFPDVWQHAERGGKSFTSKIRQVVEEHGLTLRQVVELTSDYAAKPFVGSPQTVADRLQEWFEADGFDGLNLDFRTTDEFDAFVEGVIPILQERGLYRTEYEATTLRGNLGLSIPENRYSLVTV